MTEKNGNSSGNAPRAKTKALKANSITFVDHNPHFSFATDEGPMRLHVSSDQIRLLAAQLVQHAMRTN